MRSNAINERTCSSIAFADQVLGLLREAKSDHDLANILSDITCELGFRYFALIHHVDLRKRKPGYVDLRDYPADVSKRIIDDGGYRRDPVIRGCFYSGGAFLWSELGSFMPLDGKDRASFEFGAKQGLNEGITVPFLLHGEPAGSCTFAGMERPSAARRLVGPAQMVGVFAFQAARRLAGGLGHSIAPIRLHPRPRDCIALIGRGYSNKQIARALGITPRTVDGYLTRARQILDAHDRAELLAAALLAGEIELHELRRQPE